MPEILAPKLTATELLRRAEALVPVLARRAQEAEHLRRTRANQAYVARLAVRATNRLFEVSGGHGLFETAAIQRFHRDVNAGSHQTALSWQTTSEEYARRRLAMIQTT